MSKEYDDYLKSHIDAVHVIFEGQKLTFDEEDSAKFVELAKNHFRKLAGLRGDER